MRSLVTSLVVAMCLFISGQSMIAQVLFTETFNYTKTGALVDCAALSVK